MALYRVDFQGALHGTEAFQHGHHVSSADTAFGVASDAAAQWLAILAVSSFSNLFHTGVSWTQVNVSELGATPSAPIITSAQAPIADAGTATTTPLPNQISIVCSIQTATAGSRARGRMFLPPPVAANVTATGRFNTGSQAILADNLEDYFDAMTTAGHDLVVVSGVGGAWTAYPAINIRVGEVFDTQRNRRNQLAEVYTTRTV